MDNGNQHHEHTDMKGKSQGRGALSVVGTGIRFGSQITLEARSLVPHSMLGPLL
jgi:hypothetical protein